MVAAERAGYIVTMFCIDVSSSMGRTRVVEVASTSKDGGEETKEVEMTNLEWAVQYVLLKVQEMIFNERKTDQCGVILFGTEETNNIINERNGGYDRVVEYIPIGQPNSGTLAKLQALQASEESGDPIDAIIVAIETQDDYLKKKKTWTRKMVVLTDGESPIEVEDWELTVKKIKDLQVITTIIGVDFDDEEFGVKQEDKTRIKLENEKFFHMFSDALGEEYGRIGTTAEALYECQRPEAKMTKSVLIGQTLRLGDFETRPEEAIEIPVKMSKCTALARPAALKKFAKRTMSADEGSMQVDNGKRKEEEDEKDVYAQLKQHTEYYIAKAHDSDGEDDGGGEEDKAAAKVDQEQLVRGFKYGASYVPCPDGQFPRLGSNKGIDICGFFPDHLIRREYGMGEVQYVWPDPTDGKNQAAFSSIVQAMHARHVVAIARLVSRDDMDPRMGLLIPREFEKIDCFLWLMMPFADDVRRYVFPPLLNLVSKKGEKVESHPYLPTKEQDEAMEKFVDGMDLMQAGEKDEEGNRTPWFDPRLSYNPAVHRIKQALFHAAIASDLRTNPLPPPHGEVTKYFEPPKRVLKRARPALEECKQKFEIKQVPRKVTRKRKDGHVRAEDDDDEPLFLDQPPKRIRAGSKTQDKSEDADAADAKPTQTDLSTQATLADADADAGPGPNRSNAAMKVESPRVDRVLVQKKETNTSTDKDKDNGEEKMDVDSATEDEDEDELMDLDGGKSSTNGNGKPKDAHPNDSPASTFASQSQSTKSQAKPQSQSQSQSQAQPQSQSQSQPKAPTASQLNALSFDDAFPSPPGARIGKAHPLQDFHTSFKKYGAGAGAEKGKLKGLVKELGDVVAEIVGGPLARRRFEEMRKCLEAVRGVCVEEGEAQPYNATLQALKQSTFSGPSRPFWDFLLSLPPSSLTNVGLITRDEAPGGVAVPPSSASTGATTNGEAQNQSFFS